MDMKKKKEYKIGDVVTTHLFNSSHEKRKIVGKVKKVTNQFGTVIYTITSGVVEDFNVKSVK